MKAYAILQGGGVKGAALAGCLAAAEERGIQFAGYGGTSAGSIVALLAAAGFKGVELKHILTTEVKFAQFLGDDGKRLQELKKAFASLNSNSKISLFFAYLRHKQFFSELNKELGLYTGKPLQEWLLKKIKEKHASLTNKLDITFDDLKQVGCAPFKAVVSDVYLRQPVVYSGAGGAELNGSVIDAVRASVSFPLVFKPVKHNNRYFVDGGLSSNLPTFLFENERKLDGHPVIAFSLLPTPVNRTDDYCLKDFIVDMALTSVDSSDHIQKRVIDNVYYVTVRVPQGINTLDFNLPIAENENLFNAGHAATSAFFSSVFPQGLDHGDIVKNLQALYAPPHLVVPILRTVVESIEKITPARNVRASVMLPTDHGTRIVVYHFGMERDPDLDLELNFEGGLTGHVWKTRSPSFADLDDAKIHFSRWDMTQGQQNKVRTDRKAMCCVPIFDLGLKGRSASNVTDLTVIGTLSVDTDTPLTETLWTTEKTKNILDSMTLWSDIIGKVIS